MHQATNHENGVSIHSVQIEADGDNVAAAFPSMRNVLLLSRAASLYGSDWLKQRSPAPPGRTAA